MYLRHQTYTLYYRDVCILVFLHVFAYCMLLRCMLKFMCLACGSDDVTQYNTLLAVCAIKYLSDELVGVCRSRKMHVFSCGSMFDTLLRFTKNTRGLLDVL